MRYSELNDKDRWAAIRAGVRAGYTNIDDIEKAYNEYAEGGHEYATKGDLRASALYGDAAQNFTNQMWNSKAGLEARKNSNDFMTQVAALKEEERQKQIQDSLNKKEVERLKMLAKDGTIKNKELLSLINNPNSSNDDILNAYRTSLNKDVDYGNYDTGIAKMAGAWGVDKDKLERIDNIAGLAEAIPFIGTGMAAVNIGGNLGAAILHSGQGHLKDAAKSAAYLLPGSGVVKSIKASKAGNPMTWRNVTGIGRGIYGLGDVATGVADGISDANSEQNAYGNIASGKMNEIYDSKYNALLKQYPEYFNEDGSVKDDAWYNIQQIDPDFYDYINNDASDKYMTTKEDGVVTYNPYQQMIDNKINKRHEQIQAQQLQQAQQSQNNVQQTSVPVTTNTQTQQRVPVAKTPVAQTNTTNTQQQIAQRQVQQPTKMQGFMSKLGQAAPYLADFVGWTLGNSKFFNYGGNIYEIKG